MPENGSGTIQRDLRIARVEHRASEMEDSLRELREELRRLRDNHCGEITSATEPRLSDLIAITEQMFGTPEVSVFHDPEDPGAEFVVFTVTCGGRPDEIVEKRIEWHDRVEKVAAGCFRFFRLSVVPAR